MSAGNTLLDNEKSKVTMRETIKSNPRKTSTSARYCKSLIRYTWKEQEKHTEKEYS